MSGFFIGNLAETFEAPSALEAVEQAVANGQLKDKSTVYVWPADEDADSQTIYRIDEGEVLTQEEYAEAHPPPPEDVTP